MASTASAPAAKVPSAGAGARRLKLFPAFAHGPVYLPALRDVLPRHVGLWAVGGVDAENIRQWLEAGAEGVALGGALYRPGRSAAEVRAGAGHIIAALRR